MVKFILALFLFSSASVRAQVRVQEIKLQVEDMGRNNEGDRNVSIRNAGKYRADIIYPVVVAPDKKSGDKINSYIKSEVLYEDDTVSIKHALNNRIREGYSSADFEVTLNTASIFSMKVSYEACGAYCSSNDRYFNFNPQTGEVVRIEDVIADTASFTKLVLADKIKALSQYNQTDRDADSIVADLVKECEGRIDIQSFQLTTDKIIIADRCDFPHYIRAYEPDYTLEYSYKKIAGYIKMRSLSSMQK